MKKWASISLAAFMLCGNGIPLQAEGEQQVHIVVHAAGEKGTVCQDTVYEVYQDAAASHPLLSANGDPQVVKTDENGQGTLTLSTQQFFLKLQTPAKGFYYDQTVIEGREELDLTLEPIHISFSCGTRVPVMQLRSEDGTVITCTQAEAGKTYTAFEETEDSYHAVRPVSVNVPLTGEKDPITVGLQEEIYGNAQIHFTNAGKDLAGISYEIDADKDYTQKVMDQKGRTGFLSQEEIENTQLLPGSYYLKITNMPLQYAVMDQIVPFIVEAEKEVDIDIPLEPMKLKVHVVNAVNGYPVRADITCMQGEEKVEEANGFLTERTKTYQVNVALKEPGYFQLDPQSVNIPSDAKDPIVLTCKAVPFHVLVKGVDQESNKEIAVKYEIRSPQGGLFNEIHAGDTVIFHETECEGGYLSASDVSLVIPSKSEEVQNYEVVFSHAPFVVTTLHAPAGTRIALFTDEACTENAKDCYGRNATAVTDVNGNCSFAMANGTYYSREISVPDGYCMDSSLLTLNCQRDNGPILQRTYGNQRIAIQINSTKADQPMAGITYAILERGEPVTALQSTGADRIDHDLLAGHTYDIIVFKVDGQYVYKTKQTVSIPENGELQTICFSYEPFVNLVLSTDVRTEVAGALYTDEACTEKLKDIYGSPCDLYLSSYGSTKKVLPGTYWFCNEATSHYYRNVTQVTVPAEETNVKQIIPLEGADVTIEILNEDNTGHVMELYDAAGKLIKTWNSDGEKKEIENNQLEPGKEYVLADKATGEKTAFTVPESSPSEKPIVKVEKKENEDQAERQAEMPSVLWMVGGAAALLAAAGGGLLIHHRQM